MARRTDIYMPNALALFLSSPGFSAHPWETPPALLPRSDGAGLPVMWAWLGQRCPCFLESCTPVSSSRDVPEMRPLARTHCPFALLIPHGTARFHADRCCLHTSSNEGFLPPGTSDLFLK